MEIKKLLQKLIIFLVCLFLAIPAFADELNFDAYAITEDEQRGTILFTEKDSKVVSPSLNPGTNASGTISQPEPLTLPPREETGCTEEHYHGTLFNEEDPNPKKCGWGRVKKIKNPSNININLVSFTIKAIDRLTLLFSNFSGGFIGFSNNPEAEEAANLTFSIDDLKEFLEEKIKLIDERLDSINDARDNKEISSVTVKKFFSSLGCAQRTAKDVIRRIKKLKERILAGEDLSSPEDREALKRIGRRIDTIRNCLRTAQETAFN